MLLQRVVAEKEQAGGIEWRRGIIMVITTARLHSTKPELRFCADSNLACGVFEIGDGEDL